MGRFLSCHECFFECYSLACNISIGTEYMEPSHWIPISYSVWKVPLSVCLNVISQFKNAQKAKQSRPAKEGRREAAAFTVSHESLQPTVLDLCHARSLLLSFFPSLSLSISARSGPLRRPAN